MKRIVMAAVFMVLLAATGREAAAEDGAGIEAGIRMWVNQWHQDRPTYGSTSSDTTTLIGPAIEAKLGQQMFLEASYLVSASDYSFYDPGGNFTISRQDVDIAVGYRVIPELGLLLGYRDSIFEEGATGTKDTLSGPTLGVSLEAPVDQVLSFYGRLTYLFTQFKQQDAAGVFREDSPGWVTEFGVSYRFTPSFRGTFGYRYETNTGSTSSVQDSFGGVVFGAMFAF